MRHGNRPGQSQPFPGEGVVGDDTSLVEPLSDETRFPVKGFAQMCLDERSSTLRLESHVVETLVLGSMGPDDTVPDANLASGGGLSNGRDALAVARKDGLSAICEFHGTGGWSMVDHQGLIGNGDVGSSGGGDDKNGSAEPWREVLWKWYDARF